MKQVETTRKCIATGNLLPKGELLRFTLTPDGVVIPDFNKKLPGKGVYVSIGKKLLEKAIEKNLFTKAFKQKAKAESDLVEICENLLKKKGLESINLARKAGVLISGFDKVTDAAKKGKVMFVLEANDAGKDGHQKILAAAKNAEFFDLYSTMELDKALDKINTVHVAFIKSDMADRVKNDLIRFKSFLEN